MKRHALFVGVNTYDDPSIRPLRFSVPDASVLADRFGRLGFETRLLPDPTGAELLSAVEDCVAGLGPGDVFLFFFAGHGFTAQDGAHLLFCKNDRQRLLRVNNAGIRVDALEALTDDGGFHRAFLLDSCRTDSLSGAEARGSETRDLDFVAMPSASASTGSFFLLRSCDKFRPSLELDDLGHGLFTQGLLDAMDARDERLAACDTSFATAVRDRMEDLQRRHHVAEPQRPSLGEVSGASFTLFQDGFIKAGQAAPSVYMTSATALVVCQVCGKKNDPKDTFKCLECGRDNLCLRHQDEATFLCVDCARRKHEAEIQRKAAKHAKSDADKGVDTPVKPATDSATNQLFDRILGICGEARDEYGWSKLHIEGSIPAEKLENFRRTAVQRGKDVKGVLAAEPIALCDNTVFGSAKNGFLFTERGIAVSDSWPAKTPAGYVTWEEFVGPGGCVEQDDSTEYNILLFKEKEVSISTDIAATGRSTSFALSFFRRIRKAVGETLAISPSAHGADSPLSFPEAVAFAFNAIHCDRFWIGEAIPSEKKTNAAMAMGVGADDIIALYDDTFWGGAREGFVVTGKGFHFKNVAEEAEFIPWPEVGGLFIFCEKNKLHVGKREVNCTFMDAKGQEVAKALETLASRFV